MAADPCPGYVSLVVHAADGTLDVAGRARLDEHLLGCSACREALDGQLSARRVLAMLPAVQASPFFAARLRADLDASRPWTDRIDFRRWTWRVLPLAAGLGLAAFLAVRAETVASRANVSSAPDAPVSAALWSDSVSDTSVLSLMLRANVDESLDTALAETTQ